MIERIPTLIAIGFASMAASQPAAASPATLDRMPVEIETRFALSAAPPQLRNRASVHLLDPAKGYYLSQQGTNGVTCVVQRTAWELADFRDDIYIPLCYDAAGTTTYLKVIMDVAALRAQGLDPGALKAEIERRYREQVYKFPERGGLSYMVAPVIRTVGPPDMSVHTMAMPHLMFYAPYVTNDDIGADPDLGVPASLLYPFIDRQGNAEQSYMIQLVGEAEKAKMLRKRRYSMISAPGARYCAFNALNIAARDIDFHSSITPGPACFMSVRTRAGASPTDVNSIPSSCPRDRLRVYNGPAGGRQRRSR